MNSQSHVQHEARVDSLFCAKHAQIFMKGAMICMLIGKVWVTNALVLYGCDGVVGGRWGAAAMPSRSMLLWQNVRMCLYVFVYMYVYTYHIHVCIRTICICSGIHTFENRHVSS
jgi:hypothetical protein